MQDNGCSLTHVMLLILNLLVVVVVVSSSSSTCCGLNFDIHDVRRECNFGNHLCFLCDVVVASRGIGPRKIVSSKI